MGERMEKINEAQLQTVLRGTGSRLQRRLSSSDGSRLAILMESLTRRFPNQGQEETIKEFMIDYARLVQKYSLQRVEEALSVLRMDPEQRFFPSPNEVAAAIEERSASRRYDGATADWKRELREQARRAPGIKAFREAWLASGMTLAEFCKSPDGQQFE